MIIKIHWRFCSLPLHDDVKAASLPNGDTNTKKKNVYTPLVTVNMRHKNDKTDMCKIHTFKMARVSLDMMAVYVTKSLNNITVT